ncbi:hypothetical protein AB7C87_01495 [Natrarchaeobius sp. A-rgal3]|uniref:hypothetical protein n=1 Tax=Natrarchaeobius versutus TaxID=1679078 RepID=UPI0035103DD5
MVRTDSRDRGQMILIGGIVIAFVILATIVAFNGLVHTEELSSSSTGQSATDAEVAEYEVEQALQEIAKEDLGPDGLAGAIDSEDDIDEILRDEGEWEETLNNHQKLYNTITSSERVEITHATLDTDATEGDLGAVTDITYPQDFTGNPEEILYDGERIFYFKIGLDESSPQSVDGTTFEVEKSDGTTIEIEMEHDGPGHSDTFNVTADGNDCSDIKEVNFVSGETDPVNPSDCEDMAVIDPDEEYEEIRITDRNGQIEYDLVGIGEIEEGEELPATLHVVYTYESNDAVINRTSTVDLYGGSL